MLGLILACLFFGLLFATAFGAIHYAFGDVGHGIALIILLAGVVIFFLAPK